MNDAHYARIVREVVNGESDEMHLFRERPAPSGETGGSLGTAMDALRASYQSQMATLQATIAAQSASITAQKEQIARLRAQLAAHGLEGE